MPSHRLLTACRLALLLAAAPLAAAQTAAPGAAPAAAQTPATTAATTTAATAAATVEVPPKAAVCIDCHGPRGNPGLPGMPVLAGQTARYLYLQLRDFQQGRRHNEQMSPVATGLTREEMRALSSYFAAQKPVTPVFQPDPARARLGKARADEALCNLCHLGGFAGQNEIPRVVGQPFDYIVKQLRDFKARQRTNDAGNMGSVAATLSDDDIINIAHYIAGL